MKTKMKINIILTIFVIFVILYPSYGKNLNEWHQINIDGFGNKYNIAIRGIEIFHNSLIVGTTNINNLENFSLELNHSTIRNILRGKIILADLIYSKLESNGCEIWAYNGEWKPLIKGGFGNKNNLDCSVLIEFNGYLYAGLWNHKEGCQIWKTKDLKEWEKVVDEGFGNKNNAAIWVAKKFQDYLYVGTMNFKNGCEIFRTKDGINWQQVVGKKAKIKSGFGNKNNFYAWSMEVYNNCLYVGTANSLGCELWATKNGMNWKPIVAYGKMMAELLELSFSRGFGKSFLIDGIRRMIVYNNNLYLSLTRPAYGEVYIDNIPILSIPPMGAQLCRYNASHDKWQIVLGGHGRKNNSNGFGDNKNIEIWSLTIYNNFIYAGTMHPEPAIVKIKANGLKWKIYTIKNKGAGEIWRYGNEWKQVVGDEAHALNPENPPNGFGDEYNIGIRVMKVYNDSLIAGTLNINTGCEIWIYRRDIE